MGNLKSQNISEVTIDGFTKIVPTEEICEWDSDRYDLRRGVLYFKGCAPEKKLANNTKSCGEITIEAEYVVKDKGVVLFKGSKEYLIQMRNIINEVIGE